MCFIKRNWSKDYLKVKVFERDPLGFVKAESVLMRETSPKTSRRWKFLKETLWGWMCFNERNWSEDYLKVKLFKRDLLRATFSWIYLKETSLKNTQRWKSFNERNEFEDYPKVKVFQRKKCIEDHPKVKVFQWEKRIRRLPKGEIFWKRPFGG